MFDQLKKILGGMLTESDNKTHDVVKHGGMYGFLAVLVLCGYHEYNKIHVAERDLAISLGILLTGTGVGVGMKTKSEHDDGEAQDQGGPQ